MADKTESKKISGKTIMIGVAVLVLVILALATTTGAFSAKADPMAQFTTQRTCSFLVMPGVSKAICSDGSVFDVKQTGEAATPAPLP
jgi:hypothetical protein